MSPNLEKLKYFIDKPITIFTADIGRKFTDEQFNDYFTGICKNIYWVVFKLPPLF